MSLARDLLAGRQEAFEPFVEAFRQRLFHFSMHLCRQREDAEEIAQEALLKVFQNLGQLKEPERVRAWVFRIARNACLMKRRRSRFAPEEEIPLDRLGPEGGLADWRALPDDLVLRHEMAAALEHAIGALPESYRAVLLLRDREGLSTGETAEILELSSDAVKTRLHRARLAVRKALDEELKGRQRDATFR